MKRIVLQAGHLNCKNNSIVSLRGNTGAPGEQELNYRIASRVAGLLRQKGFEVKQTDACANDDRSITGQDYDLFLAIHGDADYPNDNGGGLVGVCDPAQDQARVESGRIKEVIRSLYFHHAEIRDRNATSINILNYYMWKYLTAKTPCVLIELGQVQDPHDKVLLADTDRISNALARAICTAFGVTFDAPQPPVVVPKDPKDVMIDDLRGQVRTLESQVRDLKVAVESAKSEMTTKLAEQKAECEQKTGIFKSKLQEIINTL